MDIISPSSRSYVALIHYPVYNKNGEIITSAITNLDIHDIARTARSYNMGGYFVINPDPEQQAVAKKITNHWLEGHGSQYNVERGKALKLVEVADNLDQTIDCIKDRHNTAPTVYATTACIKSPFQKKIISFDKSRVERVKDKKPNLILLGTGWGMGDDILEKADFILEPLECGGDYNHLSVRAAAAIIIDRLLSGTYE